MRFGKGRAKVPIIEEKDAETEAKHVPSHTISTLSEPGSSEAQELLSKVVENDEEVGQSTISILHRRVLPVTLVIVMLSYIDRGNLGFVAADVCTRLNMNHTRYGIGVGVFGLGYVTSQVPSNYVLRRFGATLWFTVLLVSWGIVAASFSFMTTRVEFYVLRFLLGIAEGGTFPGVWYFLSTFYPSHYLTMPYASIEGAIAISSPLAASFAAGLLSLDSAVDYAGWRLLFLVEGIMPILFGISLYWILPSTPEQARFLNNDQKQWIIKHEAEEEETNRDLAEEIKRVTGTTYFWIIAGCAMVRGVLLTTAFYWTTLIIDDMLNGDEDDDDDSCATSKSTDVKSVALTAIPFTVAAIQSLVFGRLTSSSTDRAKITGLMISASGLFLVGWVVFRHVSFVVALLSLSIGIGCFIFPNALLLGLVSSFFDKESRATAIAIYNTMAGIGMFLGPIVLGWMVDSYGYGIAVTILAVAAVFAGVILCPIIDPLSEAFLYFHETPEIEEAE